MIAIPVIELQQVSSTRSPRGAPASHDSSNAVVEARALANIGFSRVQLEGWTAVAHDDASAPLVEDIARETDAMIQVAEASTGSEIERMLRAGAEYAIVGCRSVEEPDWLREMADLYPERLLVRTAVGDRRVVRHGWVRTLPHDILDFIEELNGMPLAGVLIGGLQFEGIARSRDLALVDDLVESSRNPLIVSAKITTLNDLRALEHRGAAAVSLRADQLSGELAPLVVVREFGN